MARPARSAYSARAYAHTAAPPAPASTPQLDERNATPPPPAGARNGANSKQGLRRRTGGLQDGAGHAQNPDEGSDARTPRAEDDDDDGAAMLRWGIALVACSAVALFLGLWSMLLRPLCAPSGIWVLDALVQDTHYKYLVVLLVPVTTCFVIVNWWGLKIFRHA
ncbi:hypothetical protein JCM10449v2_002943 [Rhodotorula kratochvilovae]